MTLTAAAPAAHSAALRRCYMSHVWSLRPGDRAYIGESWCGRVDDDLMAAGENRVLVGYDARRPAGTIGRAAVGSQGHELWWGHLLIAGAKRTRARRVTPVRRTAVRRALRLMARRWDRASRPIAIAVDSPVTGSRRSPLVRGATVALPSAVPPTGPSVAPSSVAPLTAANAVRAGALRGRSRRKTKPSPPACLASCMASSARLTRARRFRRRAARVWRRPRPSSRATLRSASRSASRAPCAGTRPPTCRSSSSGRGADDHELVVAVARQEVHLARTVRQRWWPRTGALRLRWHGRRSR